MGKMIVRLVENVLGYAKTCGGAWKLVVRENIAGLENEKGDLRLRQPMIGETAGEVREVEI